MRRLYTDRLMGRHRKQAPSGGGARDESEFFLQKIVEAMTSRNAVLFVGAGASAAAGLPTWNELIEDLKSALIPQTDIVSNELIAQFFRNQFDDRELIQRLRQRFARTQPISTGLHDVLASFPLNVFVTTNYDTLLETSLRARRLPLHVICDDVELTQWDEANETQLIKLHGDL